MKIVSVQAFALYLPVPIDVLGLDHTAGLSMCLVRIETDQGQVGWGLTGITEEEVIAEAVNKVAGPAIIGLERFRINMNQIDGNKSVFRVGAVRGAMHLHRASAATPPGSRFDPPQAGCF